MYGARCLVDRPGKPTESATCIHVAVLLVSTRACTQVAIPLTCTTAQGARLAGPGEIDIENLETVNQTCLGSYGLLDNLFAHLFGHILLKTRLLERSRLHGNMVEETGLCMATRFQHRRFTTAGTMRLQTERNSSLSSDSRTPCSLVTRSFTLIVRFIVTEFWQKPFLLTILRRQLPHFNEILFMTMISVPSPPWTGLGRRLESAVRKALYDFKMLDRVDRLGVALSGGKDSLTMLLLLKAILGKGFPPIDLIALHVGGDISCGAGFGHPFLIDACKQMRIKLVSQPMPPFNEEIECYSCSRRRRKILFDMAREEGCPTIAFGHHRDDNAQTFLMNLLHKGECAGLLPKIALHKYNVTIIRPLIYLAENDISTFAKHYGFQRIVCRCLAGQHSVRKKTDQLLSSLEQIFPNARNNVATASLVYGSTKAQEEKKLSTRIVYNYENTFIE